MQDMVAIHAIVRREMVDRVVHRLKDSGVPRLTVAKVHAIGAGVDPAAARVSLDELSEYADKALVVFVCPGERQEMFTELLIQAARTGRQGDGIVYAQPVTQVVKIRTGTTGLEALR